MAKLTAVLVTIIGILLVIQQGGWIPTLDQYNGWIIAVLVLIVGIGKLIRNFSSK